MKLIAAIVLVMSVVGFGQTTQPSEGQADLLAGDYAGAIEAFTADLENFPKAGPPKDEQHVNALHGLAVAYARTGELAKARTLLERARASKFTNRTLQINCAVIDAQAKGTMTRAANEIALILAEGDVDENLLNMMGKCIAENGRGKAKALEGRYRQIEQRLESTKPGMRRFGSQWVSAANYEETVRPSHIASGIAKEENLGRLAEKEMNDAKREIKQLNAQIIATRDAGEKEQLQSQIQYAQKRYAEAEARVKAAKKRIDQLEDSYPQPSWTCTYETVLPDWDLKAE